MHVSRMTVLAATFSTLAFAAQAVTVNLDAASTNGAGNQAADFAPNFGAFTPTDANFDKDPQVTPPPAAMPGFYNSPFNNTVLANTRDFFSVFNESVNGGATSPVMLTYDDPIDSFQILWGSIDTYNTIEFFDASGDFLMAFTGQQVIDAANIPIFPDEFGNFQTVALLTFGGFGDEGLGKVTFSSTQSAFEFALDRPSTTVIPLPASALLLFGALGGLGMLSRRRKTSEA
jgi:hypothetical protein